MRRLVIIAVLLLAGCGSRTDLIPRAGQTLPPKAAAATATPTPEQLMTPDTQARPIRNDDILQGPDVRQTDRFDLPPPGTLAGR